MLRETPAPTVDFLSLKSRNKEVNGLQTFQGLPLRGLLENPRPGVSDHWQAAQDTEDVLGFLLATRAGSDLDHMALWHINTEERTDNIYLCLL